MSVVSRLWSLAFAGLLFLSLGAVSGCNDTPEGCKTDDDCEGDLICNVEGQCEEPGPQACTQNAQCPSGHICQNRICVEVTVCDVDADCPDGEQCDIAEGYCGAQVCFGSDDCGDGQVCRRGACADPFDASTASSCTVLTGHVALVEGASRPLTAVAYNAEGEALQAGSFGWASGDADIAAVSTAGAVTGGSTSGATTITAIVTEATGVSCTSDVRNFAASTAAFRVAVVDDVTVAPVAGAKVVVNDQTADVVDGVAEFTGITPPATVSVFHGDYHYVTFAAVSATDVLVPLTSLPIEDETAGYQGEFDYSPITNTGDVRVGIAGASIKGNLVDINFETLLGESIRTRVKFGTLYDDYAPIPGGVTLGIAQEDFKKVYYGAAPPEQLVIPWGLGGKLPLPRLIQVLTPVIQNPDDVNFGEILAAILPFFDTFNHALSVPQSFDGLALVPDSDDRDGDSDTQELRPDYDGYTNIDLTLKQPLKLGSIFTVPRLPEIPYFGRLDAALLISAAYAEAAGFVPTGITVGVDGLSDPDQKDGILEQPAGGSLVELDPGQLRLRSAPLHSGLENSQNVAVALALQMNALGGLLDEEGGDTSAEPPAATSGVVMFPERMQQVTMDEFVGFAGDSSFDVGTREITIGGVTGADVTRMSFGGQTSPRWFVYAGGDGETVTLPAVPAGFIDRIAITDATVPESRAEAIRFAGSETYAALVSFNDTNLEQLDRMVGGFSVVECKIGDDLPCTIAVPTR